MIVPPIKCQGIKTKIVPLIKEVAPPAIEGLWIEPFCGSCVVALNIQPKRALLADTNKHIITFYRAIQSGEVTADIVREYLHEASTKLSKGGADYYYEVRERFNTKGDPLDFLFLNRSCFNGVMRFNSKGAFNVPFCHKPDRFSPSYITKIVNQVKAFSEVIRTHEWRFEILDFRETFLEAKEGDLVYVDPPYAGRHVDYYNSWSGKDEMALIARLKALPCHFLLSTWHSNKYRTNPALHEHWLGSGYYTRTRQHFYHVGPTEELRNAMIEALVANYPIPETIQRPQPRYQTLYMFAGQAE